MRQNLRYISLIVPNKIKCEVRISVEDGRGDYTSITTNGDKSTQISLYPIVIIGIVRPLETDENGRRMKGKWNPNDNLGINKYSLPVFISNLETIRKDMEKPELYSYVGKKLEINEELAEKIRNPFVVGTTTVEFSAVVITQPDESRVEGIKMKFMNEQSSVLLTLNDLDSLIFNLKTLDVDSIAMLMYTSYILKPNGPTEFNGGSVQSNNNVDILPKEKDFDRDFV